MPVVVLGVVALWMLAAGLLNHAPAADSVELFEWAQSPQWGYVKHPPLPVILVVLMQTLAGPAPWIVYALAFGCLAITGLATMDIARLLLGRRAAAFAGLFWTLVQYFSWRGFMFNHNTVLVTCIALAVWFTLLAQRHGGFRFWVLAGVAAAGALLTKYQAVVPLLFVVIVLAWNGDLRDARTRYGLALASGVAAVLFAPHVVWLVKNQFAPLHYAGESLGADLPLPARLARIASFLAVQLRANALMLLVAGTLALSGTGGRHGDALAQPVRRWFVGLVVAPLLAVLALCLIVGVDLQAAWGMQTLQFACIPLAAWTERRCGEDCIGRLLKRTLLWQAASIALFAAVSVPSIADDLDVDNDRMYPAKELASTLEVESNARAPCPINLVVGPSFEAGLVSLLMSRHPRVLARDRPGWSVGVNEEVLLRTGTALYLDADGPVGGDVISKGVWHSSNRSWHVRRQRSVQWTLVTLSPACSANIWE